MDPKASGGRNVVAPEKAKKLRYLEILHRPPLVMSRAAVILTYIVRRSVS